MSRKKYKCDNCNHEFEANLGDTICPECGSSNTHKIGNAGGDGLNGLFKGKWPMIIGIGVVALIILILIGRSCSSNSTSSSDSEIEFSVVANQVQDYIEFEVFKYSLADDGSAEKKKIGQPANVLKELKVKTKEGNLVEFMDGNKLYPCKEMGYAFIWNGNHPKYKMRDGKHEAVVDFKLNGNKPNPKADCAEPLEITDVKANNDCQMVVSTNYDGKSKKVMISVTGPKGPYTDKKVWDGQKINKINVWAYVDGVDTVKVKPVASIKNKQTFYPRGCIACTDEIKAEKLSSFVAAANAFGKQPNDASKRNNFTRHLVGAQGLNIKFNGRSVQGGLSGLLNELKIEFENSNETKAFKLSKSSVVIDNKCEIAAFEFTTSK